MVKKMATFHDPTESLRETHFSQLGVDSHYREVFNQKDEIPE